MAWTEAERIKVRDFLGYGTGLFHQSEPRLENALNAVQSVADGGTRPDSSSEDFIRDIITKLDGIETSIAGLYPCLGTAQVGGIRVDPVRSLMVLQQEGRRHIGRLASALNTKPVRDYFSQSDLRSGEGFSVVPGGA